MLGRILLLAALFACCTAPAFARYADPDAPEVEAAARAALAGAKVLDVRAKVLDIVGIGREVAGRIDDLDAAKRDLKAKESDTEIRIELAADVLFDFDKANIRRDAHDALTKVATILKAMRGPVTIEGHTDGKGKAAYNQKLSERRAAAVKDWLVKSGGIEARRIATRGWGMQRPAVPNAKPDGRDDPEGRQKNRRVEITVKKA